MKKFWEMTNAEFIKHYLREAYKKEYGGLSGYEIWLNSPFSSQEVNVAAMNADDDHYDWVAHAVAECEEVPQNVLNDYPILRKVVANKKADGYN